MPVSDYIQRSMEAASWIRRMFERGRRLKAEHGEDAVFDFSLGNPVMEPPEAFFEGLARVAAGRGRGEHRYMPNAGFPEVRARVAEHLGREGILDTDAEGVVLCVGAGGGLNVVFKTILDPGDEVVILAPYFVEYLFYIENHGGKPVVAETDPAFLPDPEAIERVLSPRTRAIVLNSPNNPTGRVYPEELLRRIAEIAERHGRTIGRPVYVVSDEPYRTIAYDGVSVPGFLRGNPHGILVFSWSKSLSIAGDRIGYVAVDRNADPSLVAGLTFANRILGFVNAPATMQLVVGDLLGTTVDVAPYRAKRDRLLAGLREAGYDVVTPEGAFYLFPAVPGGDDRAFAEAAAEERVLVVPGSGFGRAGYIRISYAVDDRTVEGGLEALARLAKRGRTATG